MMMFDDCECQQKSDDLRDVALCPNCGETINIMPVPSLLGWVDRGTCHQCGMTSLHKLVGRTISVGCNKPPQREKGGDE